MEDVQVSRDEDETIERLCDERHALGGVVAVDCEDEDTFRESMGDVSQYAEWLINC